MYNNSYQSSGYPTAYQQYPTGYDATAYSYQGYGQYQSQPSQPVPPGDNSYSQQESNWNTVSYGSSQKDAVAQEMQQQKAQLVKQREDYVRKVSVLRRELDQLRTQKQDLLGDERGSKRDLTNILKENDKLQEEIQGKMKAIQNVIEMLSSIIKDGQSISDLEAALTEKDTSGQHYEESYWNKKSNDSKERYNYVHYDTGLHWCRLCDEFPETAKEFLLHLQEKVHQEAAKENDVDNTPWHKLPAEPVLESYEDAPTKRIPIKGLQFFISAPSWYCKLCDVWIGDLHCASHHLKSKAHFQNYENFVSQNPRWEMEWLKDREKAMERRGGQNSSDESDHHRSRSRKRHREKRSSESKDKKKKKRSKKRRKKSSDSSSSSSSSDSSSDDDKADRSKSIRVTMRNVKSIMDEDLSGKWSVLEKLVEEHKKKQEEMEKIEREKHDKKREPTEDPLINQWMTVSEGKDNEKALFNSLKDKMKMKQEQEKAKYAEIERREREEMERLKRQEQEEREVAEQRDRERKRREEEEMNRIRNKERNQLKFKPNSRNRDCSARSDDEHESYYRDRDHKDRNRRDSERHRSRSTRSRSRSSDRKGEDNDHRRKPPGPPSYKKLPFIGRMPLFKNKKMGEEKEEKKEIQKESYEIPRRTRFEPGNLPRAFMPKPDVVCFPKLSCIPELIMPPPQKEEKPEAPEPPKITKEVKKEELQAPPPPKLDSPESHQLSDDEALYGQSGEDMGQYYQEYSNAMYSQEMYYQSEGVPPPPPSMVPHSHTLPLEPPPLPPEDDLAMLGICADDMAAQTF